MRKARKTETVYYQKCDTCEKEFVVLKDNQKTTCYKCRNTVAMEKSQKEADEVLVGAVIVSVKLKGYGTGTSADELTSLKVKTKEEKIIELEAEGWDERYIGWAEVEEKVDMYSMWETRRR